MRLPATRTSWTICRQTDDLEAVLALDGLDRFEARKRIVAMLEERELLVADRAAYARGAARRPLGRGDRALPHRPVVREREAARRARARRRARRARRKFVPENWEKTYFQWLENIEPWCVSRQLWWGHQIPAWYDDRGQRLRRA